MARSKGEIPMLEMRAADWLLLPPRASAPPTILKLQKTRRYSQAKRPGSPCRDVM
jgi:hypothetical protein